jgi:hypothetical protein
MTTRVGRSLAGTGLTLAALLAVAGTARAQTAAVPLGGTVPPAPAAETEPPDWTFAVRIGPEINLEPQFEKASQKWGGGLTADFGFVLARYVTLGFRFGVGGASGGIDSRYEVPRDEYTYYDNSILWYGILGAVCRVQFIPGFVVTPTLGLDLDLWLGSETRDIGNYDVIWIVGGPTENHFFYAFHPTGRLGVDIFFGEDSHYGISLDGGAGYLLLGPTMFYQNTYTADFYAAFAMRF